MSRRLPETDIANISVLPEKEQYMRLRRKRSFKPPHSLQPSRNCLGTLVGVTTPMFGSDAVSEKEALSSLRSSIKNLSDMQPNINRAQAILNLRRRFIERAVHSPMRSHRITIDNSINLTHSLAIQTPLGPTIPFVDLRKSGQLSRKAQDFIFAMNFHMLIDAEADYSEFGLTIWKYWEESNSNLGISPVHFDGMPKYSYEQLTDMIAMTYRIWLEVLDERKKKSSDDKGEVLPLFRHG